MKTKISYAEVLPENPAQLSQLKNIGKNVNENSVTIVAQNYKVDNHSQNGIEENLPFESVAIVAHENIGKNLLLNPVAIVAKGLTPKRRRRP